MALRDQGLIPRPGENHPAGRCEECWVGIGHGGGVRSVEFRVVKRRTTPPSCARSTSRCSSRCGTRGANRSTPYAVVSQRVVYVCGIGMSTLVATFSLFSPTRTRTGVTDPRCSSAGINRIRARIRFVRSLHMPNWLSLQQRWRKCSKCQTNQARSCFPLFSTKRSLYYVVHTE